MEMITDSNLIQCYNFDWQLDEEKDGWQATLKHRGRYGIRLPVAGTSREEARKSLYLLDQQKGDLLNLGKAPMSSPLKLFDAIQQFLEHMSQYPNENPSRDQKSYQELLYSAGLHAAMHGITLVSQYLESYEEYQGARDNPLIHDCSEQMNAIGEFVRYLYEHH